MRDLERERSEADRRYNDALTALDRALVARGEPLPTLAAPNTELPALPRGFGTRWLRRVQGWLAPLFERQRAFNSRVVEVLQAHAARERDRASSLERFQTALVVFLQQITALVETSDRLVAAATAARLNRQQQAIDALPDLQAQVAVLQRATQMLTRELERSSRQSSVDSRQSESPVARHGPPAASHRPLHDYKYVAFEDRFRGSDEEIREKLRAYLPAFAGATDVLDVGCGRGEFLALLEAAGVSARGVDSNHEMVAATRERGLEVVESDALAYLESLGDGMLGGLMAAQVVEHLEPAYLMRLLAAAYDKLRTGAPIVIETINPACWLAFFSSYLLDFTHVRAVHPETLQYLLQANGFGRVTIRYSAPVPEHMKMQAIDLGPALPGDAQAARALTEIAHTLNANAAILNNLLFTYLDYAAIGYRS